MNYCSCNDRCEECGLARDEQGIVQIIPGTGWIVEHDAIDGKRYPWPLVAWGVKANGDVVPLDTDSTGFVLELENGATVRPQLPGDTEALAAQLEQWKLAEQAGASTP